MGDAGQGADGVGNSSGNWHCDSQWLENGVVTRTTRTWVLPSYNNHLYKRIQGPSGGDNNSKYFGFSTPWGYFDYNRFHCHFSPRDWQRLINNNWGIRPKAMRFRLFNIQVKEVTVQDSNTTIANNLTSTVQVFADKDYQLPYVLGSATEGTFPPFPADIYTIPQYGYCTLNYNNEAVDRSAFYCLDYFPSDMLRTGNNFEFTYTFEDVPFHSMFAHNQTLDRLMNPLVDQYLWGFSSVTQVGSSGRALNYSRATKNNMAAQYRNWLPGPFFRDQQIFTGASNITQNNVFNVWEKGKQWELDNRTNLMQPGPAAATTFSGEPDRQAMQNTLAFSRTVYDQTTGTTDPNQILITNEDEIRPTNTVGIDTWGQVPTNNQSNVTPGTRTGVNNQGAHHGMGWQNRDIYRQGPSWAKIHDTDNHFPPSPRQGGEGYARREKFFLRGARKAAAFLRSRAPRRPRRRGFFPQKQRESERQPPQRAENEKRPRGRAFRKSENVPALRPQHDRAEQEHAAEIAQRKRNAAHDVALLRSGDVEQQRVVKKIGPEEADGGNDVNQRRRMLKSFADERERRHADDARSRERAEKFHAQSAALRDRRQQRGKQRDENARRRQRQRIRERFFARLRARRAPKTIEKNRE